MPTAPAPPVGPPVPGWTAREPLAPTTLVGRWCRVEPLAPAHADDLHAAWTADPSGRQWTYLFWEPPGSVADSRALVDAIVGDPALVAHAVVVDGRALGTASWMRVDPGHGSAEIGSILWGAALQRTPAATEAMTLMAAHVLDTLGYRRYEWKCDDLNAPSRSAAVRLGFTYEGTFRNAVVYKGRSRDTAWYAITDDDWQRLRPAHRAWLDPANFGPDGRQRTALSDLTEHALAVAHRATPGAHR